MSTPIILTSNKQRGARVAKIMFVDQPFQVITDWRKITSIETGIVVVDVEQCDNALIYWVLFRAMRGGLLVIPYWDGVTQ